MQADVGRAVGEGSVDYRLDDLSRPCRRHAAAGAERPEVDLEAQCLGSVDSRCHVWARFALDERFDCELEQQHADEL